MIKKFKLVILLFMLILAGYVYSASVGSDGGITLLLSYSGNLVTDMVINDDGDPVLDSSANQWQAKNKLEHELSCLKVFVVARFLVKEERKWP